MLVEFRAILDFFRGKILYRYILYQLTKTLLKVVIIDLIVRTSKHHPGLCAQHSGVLSKISTDSRISFRFPADGSDPIPKPKDVPRIEAYDFAVEPSNAQQLEEILADPDAMRMQALVIRERILGE